MEELLESGDFGKRLWLKKLKLKLKPDEWAKIKGYIRLIGDLGVSASLQGFRSTYYLKVAQSQCLFHDEGHSQFVKAPTYKALLSVFQQLKNPRGRFFYAYFSDDSCLAIRHNGVVYRFNIDISKCDASHSDALFHGYTRLAPERHQDDFKILIEQLQLPWEVRNPHDRKERLKFRTKRIRLASGSTITTTINNFAILLILKGILQAFDGTDRKSVV